jgi:cell division transport system permease protein
MSFRLRFLASEALTSLRNNFATTLAATVTVLIVMFFLGVFISLGSYMYAKIDQVRQDVRVRVFLRDDATDTQRQALIVRLQSNPAVKHVTYLTKQDALKEEAKSLGAESKQILSELTTNPLPATIVATLKHPGEAKSVAATMRGQPGVQQNQGVKYGESTADRFLRTTSIIEAVVGGLILLLAVAAVLLIANTIRLSIFARRREIEVMKLVGATNWFVRLPFMFEGMICGLIGAALSIVLLWAAYVALLRDWLTNSTSSPSSGDVHALAFWIVSLILLGAGVGLGAVGSGLTMRRFLRV